MSERFWKSRTIKYDAIKLIAAAIPVLLFGILCSESQIILIMHKGDSATVPISQIAMSLGVFGVLFAMILMIWASVVSVSNTDLVWRTRMFVVIGLAMVVIFSLYCASVHLKWQVEATGSTYFVASILLGMVLCILCYMIYFGKKMMDVKDAVRDQEAVQGFLSTRQRSSSVPYQNVEQDEPPKDTKRAFRRAFSNAKVNPELSTPENNNVVNFHVRDE